MTKPLDINLIYTLRVFLAYAIINTQRVFLLYGVKEMDCKTKIKELRESTGMNRKEFCKCMKKTKTKCYLYTRVSTSMQVDGYSLDAQRDKLRKYAEYEDMIVAGEYSDEGFSGKNIQGRHEFQRMLQDIQDCKDGVEYVLVFKLSRFGRNAADVLNSLQLMQDFGVNLICVEDGIDSSKDSGKLMISVLSAVAEIERENIRTQTMAGREQKAREGKWNGGFAPYGYRLEKGELLIAEDEVDVIRTIFDRYIHTNDGVSGVAKYLNRQGFVKKLRQNGTIPGFSASFVKSIIDNPVYMGKIAYGRRRTEKKIGMRCTWLSNRSSLCTRGSMRLSFQKKIGTSRRKNGKSMLTGVRKSMTLPTHIYCPVF